MGRDIKDLELKGGFKFKELFVSRRKEEAMRRFRSGLVYECIRSEYIVIHEWTELVMKEEKVVQHAPWFNASIDVGKKPR